MQCSRCGDDVLDPYGDTHYCPGKAPRRVPETQKEAWESVQEGLPEARRCVLAVFEAVPGGLTLWEVQKALGWPVNRVSGRITELVDAKLLRDSESRRINPETGRTAIIWILTRKT